MPGINEEFEHHLEEFRKEIQGGTQFFYAMLAINGLAAEDERVLDKLNEASLWWRTNIGALQVAFFVTLGRVFDQRSAYNIDKLVQLAQNNPSLFSKDSLADRKRAAVSNADEWLPEFLSRCYEPSSADFRCIRRYVRKYRKIYLENYDPIRDRIYAHKELAVRSEVSALFSKTRILEIQKLFLFLNQIFTILWELYYNGRQPRFIRIPFSSARMLRQPRLPHRSRTVQEDITAEVRDFLTGISNPPATSA